MLVLLSSSHPNPNPTSQTQQTMKTNVLLAFFFFFVGLFFAFTAAEIVYDSNGDVLNNGGRYYLLPPGYGGQSIQGAGIDKGDGLCSLAVVQKLSYNQGWATKIQSPLLTLHIATDYPLWLSFDPLPLGTCTNTPQWVVTRVLGFVGMPVMVGNANEFPLPLSGMFFIKAYDSAKYEYKLVFCHEEHDCGHVGVKSDGHGNHRLIVTEDDKVKPLVLKFVKATSTSTSDDISMVV